ncbi:MAG: nickel pincer cofactor biosynthesis protein LarB [Phycisphaerae bacterium]
MDERKLKDLLQSVRDGSVDPEAAVKRLVALPYEEMGFAVLDHHRTLRCGFPEVIYCESKTPQQVQMIFHRLADSGVNVLGTRATKEEFDLVHADFPDARWHELARCITLVQDPPEQAIGHIAVVAAGTSDLPVAEEAVVTAETMGQHVTTHYDVGVAGLHRLLSCREALAEANVIVVCAGMEGALASVVGGLVSVPVIAVPTSVGYGASFHGLSALLTMLNSCASGVSVVNIDNGFAGGYNAALINRQTARGQSPS